MADTIKIYSPTGDEAVVPAEVATKLLGAGWRKSKAKSRSAAPAAPAAPAPQSDVAPAAPSAEV